ncbi:retinol dehydrogenase 14 [Patella vulgata]|uniref:retinol dehydrogenase 14 n=1 Tax=Patella vulgata TaxID=6465 RepID=UPI0024A7E01C|nr:retinol dehydrogenase 14 [Patella vulgata]
MGADLSYPQVVISPERTYIVTGGNTGIGFCIAKEIAKMGGRVIIACRNMSKAEAMQEEYEKELKEKQENVQETNRTEPKLLNVEMMELDLASFDKTMKFIEEFKTRNCPLHVLICNAGVVTASKEMTDDGYEMMLQSNYLSHLLITLHFLPILQKSGDDARIVNVSSDAYYMGTFDPTNLNCERSFGKVGIYGNSKLFQIMSTLWLSRHLKYPTVSITSCYPGIVNTRLLYATAIGRLLSNFYPRTPLDGAATIIKAATDPEFKGVTGVYIKDCKTTSTTSYAKRVDIQNQLIDYSLQSMSKYLPTDLKDCIDYEDQGST